MAQVHLIPIAFRAASIKALSQLYLSSPSTLRVNDSWGLSPSCHAEALTVACFIRQSGCLRLLRFSLPAGFS